MSHIDHDLISVPNARNFFREFGGMLWFSDALRKTRTEPETWDLIRRYGLASNDKDARGVADVMCEKFIPLEGLDFLGGLTTWDYFKLGEIIGSHGERRYHLQPIGIGSC
ncbi:hypothetical protein HYT23_04430 [Candidatus Pacearchaeota archaeon]|nr:hypothetical protein [Candidatus Pacearchaeota archaeon]